MVWKSRIRTIGGGDDAVDGANDASGAADEALIDSHDGTADLADASEPAMGFPTAEQTDSSYLWDETDEEEPASPGLAARLMPRLAPLAFAAALIGWTASFAASHWPAMTAGAALAQWVGWVEAWSGPAVLIALVWLLASRSIHRHSRRFADSARLLGEESALLETRLTTATRELSIAREFIAAQSRDLDSLGRVAVERIGEHAGQLRQLIADNGAAVDAIASVSTTALGNMELLRGQLPVIANSARDVTNAIGNAGRIAHAQLQELVTGLTRLNEFGIACERQVETTQTRVSEALSIFDDKLGQIDSAARERFDALARAAGELGKTLGGHETAALDAINARADTLTTMIAEARDSLLAAEDTSLATLRSQLAALRDEADGVARTLRDHEAQALAQWRAAVERVDGDIATSFADLERIDSGAVAMARARLDAFAAASAELEAKLARASEQADAQAIHRQEAQRERLAELGAASAAANGQMAAIESRVKTIASEIELAQTLVLERVDRLAGTLAESRGGFTETEQRIARLTDGSVRLLELIQASVEHSRDKLPHAIAAGEERLAGVESRAAALRESIAAASSEGEALAGHVGSARGHIDASQAALTGLRDGLSARDAEAAAMLEGLHTRLAAVEADAAALAERVRGDLGAAVDRAVEAQSGGLSARIEAAATHAAAIAGQATEQMSAQLAEIDSAVASLESRVNAAREVASAAEAGADNDFARRVSIIGEALNTNAIDIAQALGSDISDTAWTSYLRGDRSIFTRRTVTLLSNTEAADVLRLFQSDEAFRGHVSRYIADFEAMLRHVLAAREGNALGVTLLSSDMGKLYVALAQATERLRS